MTADGAHFVADAEAAARARRELDAQIEEFLNDPALPEMLTDLRKRAASSKGLSDEEIAERLGLR